MMNKEQFVSEEAYQEYLQELNTVCNITREETTKELSHFRAMSDEQLYHGTVHALNCGEGEAMSYAESLKQEAQQRGGDILEKINYLWDVI